VLLKATEVCHKSAEHGKSINSQNDAIFKQPQPAAKKNFIRKTKPDFPSIIYEAI